MKRRLLESTVLWNKCAQKFGAYPHGESKAPPLLLDKLYRLHDLEIKLRNTEARLEFYRAEFDTLRNEIITFKEPA